MIAFSTDVVSHIEAGSETQAGANPNGTMKFFAKVYMKDGSMRLFDTGWIALPRTHAPEMKSGMVIFDDYFEEVPQ